MGVSGNHLPTLKELTSAAESTIFHFPFTKEGPIFSKGNGYFMGDGRYIFFQSEPSDHREKPDPHNVFIQEGSGIGVDYLYSHSMDTWFRAMVDDPRTAFLVGLEEGPAQLIESYGGNHFRRKSIDIVTGKVRIKGEIENLTVPVPLLYRPVFIDDPVFMGGVPQEISPEQLAEDLGRVIKSHGGERREVQQQGSLERALYTFKDREGEAILYSGRGSLMDTMWITMSRSDNGRHNGRLSPVNAIVLLNGLELTNQSHRQYGQLRKDLLAVPIGYQNSLVGK